jgi:Cytochrome B6-F complex subunit VI (PetL)
VVWRNAGTSRQSTWTILWQRGYANAAVEWFNEVGIILGEIFMTGAVIYIGFLGAMLGTAFALFFGLRAAKII